MNEFKAHGLPASWLNSWLAAVGATVLDPRLRLHWTEGYPVAVLSAERADPVTALVESWPSREFLSELPIAEKWHGAGTLRRQVSVEDFRRRVVAARGNQHSWTLSSTVTDLCVDDKGDVVHAPFDPAGPGTIKWLHHRLVKVWAKAPVSEATVSLSLTGLAERVEDNGLGFDQSRLGSLADKSKASALVDPIVEVLAFFGLALFPVRGPGLDGRLDRRSEVRAVQRGWHNLPGMASRCFCWPAWRQRLDRDGIDALLDVWKPRKGTATSRLGIHAAWRSVGYQPRASADSTRAYGSERL